MNSFDQICIAQKADKASADYTHAQGHQVHGHNYAIRYDAAFTPLRDKPIKIVEIGVGGGESIRSWLEYFPNAQVFGVDIVHSTNPWNTVMAVNADKPDPRYTFVAGDQSDEAFWTSFLEDYGKDWDIVVDDGSHISKDIITTSKMLWPHVIPGGWYCIEDLNCSYSGLPFFLPEGWPNPMAWLNGAQLGSGQIFSGTVSETFAAKGFNIPLGETFFRFGLISNGDGTQTKIHFDNVTLSVVPEPTTIALAGLGLAGMGLIARRRK